MAKAGVVMLTSALGLDWAPHGVRVVGVSPAYVRTPLVEQALADGSLTEEPMLERTPLGRLATPTEIAEAIVQLAAEPFTFMTGTTVLIDGGSTAG